MTENPFRTNDAEIKVASSLIKQIGHKDCCASLSALIYRHNYGRIFFICGLIERVFYKIAYILNTQKIKVSLEGRHSTEVTKVATEFIHI